LRSFDDDDDRSVIRVRPPSNDQVAREATPLERAEEILHGAYGEADPARRLAEARRALEACADCAGAYVLLATEGAKTLAERIEFFNRAVQAGERALGPKVFVENAGHFWGILEARPYLRARLGLADCLWQAERFQDALEHYRMLLKLNPGDHQNVRYRLMRSLLAMHLDEAAESLLRRYEDELSVCWVYSAALIAFRRRGDVPGTGQLRDRACDLYPKGAMFLIHRTRVPQDESMCLGLPKDHRDSIDYARHHGPYWDKTDGALAWLAAKAEPERAASAATPTRAMKSSDLLKLIDDTEE